MALLRNSTLAGSMKSEVSGSRPLSTRKLTASPSHSITWRSTGASVNMLRTAMKPARMPAEKLSTSISKPGLIFPAQSASRRFIS